MTGESIAASCVTDCREEIECLYRRKFPPTEFASGIDEKSTPRAEDDDFIEAFRACDIDGPQFQWLFDEGDTTDIEGDHSRADLALVSMIAQQTENREQTERIMSKSVLAQRSNWQDRPDYRKRTIDRAFE